MNPYSYEMLGSEAGKKLKELLCQKQQISNPEPDNEIINLNPYLLAFFEKYSDQQLLEKLQDIIKQGQQIEPILNEVRHIFKKRGLQFPDLTSEIEIHKLKQLTENTKSFIISYIKEKFPSKTDFEFKLLYNQLLEDLKID